MAATNSRDKLLDRLLARLGARISEILALTVEDVGLREGTVMIEHLKVRLKLVCPSCGARLGRCHTFCPKYGPKVTSAKPIDTSLSCR